MDGAGHVLFRIFTFTGGDADHFRPLEGEAGDHEDAQHGREAADEGRIADGPVGKARRRFRPEAQDEQCPGKEEDQDRQDLDAGEDEFAFAVGPGRQVVEDEEDNEEQAAPDGSRYVREPVFHDQGAGDEFGRYRDGPVEPVVPAQGKAQGFIDVAVGVGFKRTADRQVRRHFTEACHEEINHDTDEGIGDEGTARTGRADRFTAGDEQARADSAADGDHVHVAGFQAAAQSLLLLSFFHAKSQPFFIELN